MDEVQGTDGVEWTWGAPASVRGVTRPTMSATGGGAPDVASDVGSGVAGGNVTGGDTGRDAGGDTAGYVPAPPASDADAHSNAAPDAPDDAARVDEEWFAAGLTVRRPAVLVPPAVPDAPAGPDGPAVPEVQDGRSDEGGDSGGRGEVAETPDPAVAAEEEWFAAGLTVRRPVPLPEVDAPVLETPAAEVPAVDTPAAATPEVEEDWEAAGLTVRRPAVPVEEDWETAGLTVRRPALRVESPEPVAPAEADEPEPARHEEPHVAADSLGAALPLLQDVEDVQDEQDDGYEGRHHAAEEEARAREEAEAQETKKREAEVTAQQSVATPEPTGMVGDPHQQRWVQPEPEQRAEPEPEHTTSGYLRSKHTTTTTTTTTTAAEVDPAYTWRGEQGELYIWDGYQWVLQPETSAVSPAAAAPAQQTAAPAQQAAAPAQPAAEHTWDGPNGEYWVWDGYQWVQRERPAPTAHAVAEPAREPSTQPHPEPEPSPDYTWDGPNGEYWVWDGYQWVQRERPTPAASAVAAVPAVVEPVHTWTGDDGQVWEWDPVGREWHRQQAQHHHGRQQP